MNYKKLALAKVLKENDMELLSKLSVEQFTDRNSKTIYRAILAYKRKYSKVPAFSVLTASIENQLSMEQAKILTGYIDNLELTEVSELSDDELLEGISENFTIISVDRNIEALVEAGAARDSAEIKRIVSELSANVTMGTVKALEARDIEFSADVVKSLDSFIPSMRTSGTKLSGVVLMSGSSGGGKSILAMNQALYSYTEERADILYMNLEMAAGEQMARMLSHITATPFGDIYKSDLTDKETTHWNMQKNSFFNRPNKFKMINMTLNRDDIFSALEAEMLTGLDLCVLDYLQIVDNTDSSEQWKFIETLVKQLHQFALANGIVIVTPIQINESDIKEDTNEIKLTTRGSRELEFTSSLWLHIHQNSEEYTQGVCRLFTIKSRHAKKHIYMMETRFEVMTFTDTGVVI